MVNAILGASSSESSDARVALGDAKSNKQAPNASSPARLKLRRKVTTAHDDTTTANQRLVEYCVIVSSRSRKDDVDETLSAPDQQQQQQQPSGNIHMPQQTKQQQQQHSNNTFRPVITSRYPATDYKDDPLNPMLLQFCYPAGDVISPSTQYALPRVHYFVLTLGSGRKLYATCLTVMEEYTGEVVVDAEPHNHSNHTDAASPRADHDGGIEVVVQGAPTTVYVPKCLCLLSTWPYLTAFREYLSQLYRLATATNCMTVPLERYIVQICQEIPAPPPGAYCIQIPILESVIRFWAPAAKLPIAYTALPWNHLFEALDLDHILTVVTALLMERKVLMVSSQYSILTVVAEILCSLLFPFRWSHLYVPMLPRMLCPMLDAPVPYLCGIVRENWEYSQQFLERSVVIVDLDRNTVVVNEELPSPPAKKWGKLQAKLSATAGDVFWEARGLGKEYQAELQKKPSKRDMAALKKMATPQWDEKLATLDNAFNLAYTPESGNSMEAETDQSSRWDQVQEAFLRFFVALFKDYRNHLVINPERPRFDTAGFLAEQKAENHEFVSELCATQQFDCWVSRRMWSAKDADLVFFDQKIDEKLNRSHMRLKKLDTPLLNSAAAHKKLTELLAVPVNQEGLQKKSYVYRTLPDFFDERLFSTPRPIPKMISAEFDRQALLLSKLRGGDAESNNDLMEYYGGDYDWSPEVASFTVFLYVYSALVGQDWQKYSLKRKDEEDRKQREEQKKSSSLRMSGQFETRDDNDCAQRPLPYVLDDGSADNFIQDLSLGCCESCPTDSTYMLQSTLKSIGDGAGEAYNTLVRKPVADFSCFAMPFNTQDEKHVGMPLTDTAMAEYEEAREVAAAQLEVAFQTLATMSLRGLSADSDAYLSLMEACGRCGDTKRARKLIQLMTKDGFVADNEVLSSFIAAFARDGESEDKHSFRAAKDDSPAQPENKESDAYSRFLKKGLESAKGLLMPQHPSNDLDETESTDEVMSYGSSFISDDESSQGSKYREWKNQTKEGKKMRRKRRRQKRKSTIATSDLPVTEMLSHHLDLGESLLEFVYPEIEINTTCDSCPDCSKRLNENEIVKGWNSCAFQDYKTTCPACRHRFVPRFSVSCASPTFEGSQGKETPLYCEFLSPWVLRKEFQHFVKGVGIDAVLHPSWRDGTDIRATLFWNLIVTCRRNRLPFTFLLQGNFENRLILPRKPDEL